ncbi:MAG: acetoacetate--CoA ligase [Dehalococcoidales bacterium]|nr:acetoacetate--CoA ligase [Dehalococcoidales bacterium]
MTIRKPLWEPSPERRQQANMTRFIDFVNKKYGLAIGSYDELYEWSVNQIPDFWGAVWDFGGIRSSRQYDQVVDDLPRFPGAKWFPGARLNFAENLLRYRDDHTAFIFKGERQKSARMSYAELYRTVARLAKALRDTGVSPGDRVAAYMPNLMETAIAMLATMAVGAIWSSCATDLGKQAVLDRFEQIGPKVLFTVDGYFYKGKGFDSLANAAGIAQGISSLKKVIVVGYKEEKPDISAVSKAVLWSDFLVQEAAPEIKFEQLPFDSPALIMFSSGTTGKPKCIVQGAGVFINHLKELVFHSDLKRPDVIFYITTCSWMMWNWLLSSLAVGATIVLFDGNPNYPDAGAMWQLVQDEKVTIFGVSASYLNFLRSQGVKPGKQYNLVSLREISQTGSSLSAEGFEYVYQSIKNDLHFNSISGGTDINGCFAIGSPTLPVYAGELQRAGLGMKVRCYDEKGKPVHDRMGELVCEAPAPSMPLCFWNDPDGKKYHEAYFSVYPGVWRHGDHIIIHSDTKGITILGRSDAVIKPSGVRIGTAEIYNEVEKLPEIADSLAIGQEWRGDQRVILFVKMSSGCRLSDELKSKIRETLRRNASPRHVPAKIIEVPDIPYTLNTKKVEVAVTNIIHGRPVSNRDALINPESLDFYAGNILELQSD